MSATCIAGSPEPLLPKLECDLKQRTAEMQVMGSKPKISNFRSAASGFDTRLLLLTFFSFLLHTGLLDGQSNEPPNKVIEALVAHERQAELNRVYFSYTSEERSERTKGHQWTEQVVESADGKIRRLTAEDGTPLGTERSSKEADRLRGLAENSTAVAKEEQAHKEDEDRLQRLLALLPKAFVFEDGGMDGAFRRIFFHPSPNFSPASFEERVVHAMTGSILVSPEEHRLRAIDARLQEDVTLGFGLLARLNSGGRITMTREEQRPGEWKNHFPANRAGRKNDIPEDNQSATRYRPSKL